MPIDWEALIRAAEDARSRSYSPYSRYAVGAALQMEDGSIQAAANVENAIPALSICAERNAISQAVNAGLQHPVALVVATESSPPARPCGLCRQTLAEFADDLPIVLVNPAGDREETTLGELFPAPFRLAPR